jgi:hypothetical protein
MHQAEFVDLSVPKVIIPVRLRRRSRLQIAAPRYEFGSGWWGMIRVTVHTGDRL